MVSLTPFSGPEHQTFTIGHGPSVLMMIHGFPGTPAEVGPLARAITSDGWRVHAPLLPGFGEQIAQLDTKSRAEWLQALKAEWRSQVGNGGSHVLLGYSMGAALALLLAEKVHPDGLILINPFWRSPTPLTHLVPFVRRIGLKVRPFEKANFDDPRMRRQLEAIVPGIDLADPEVQAGIREQFILPVQAIDEILRVGRAAIRKATNIEVPLLVVQARDDALVLPKNTRRLVNRFPSNLLNYHEIDGDHHIINVDSPAFDELQQLVVGFLKRVQ